MLRSLCFLIAFLVAAKEVVAMGTSLRCSKQNTYSEYGNAIAEAWLCEVEDSEERESEADDDNSDVVDRFTIASWNEVHFPIVGSFKLYQYFLFRDSDRQLFIGLRNLRL